MRRIAVALALTLLGATTPAIARSPGEVVTEPTFGFQIWVPQGWQYGKDKDFAFAHIAMRSNDGVSGANCLAAAEEIALSKGATQAQLNESLKTPIGRDFWRNQAFKALTNVEFESDSARVHPSGIIQQEAIGTGTATGASGPQSITMLSTFLVSPGVTFSIVCASRADKFQEFRPIFTEVVDSFRSRETSGVVGAAINPAPGTTATTVSLPVSSAWAGVAAQEMGRFAVNPREIAAQKN